jgi:prepilin-type N-terminal cleavage/methylation domain-containing protein
MRQNRGYTLIEVMTVIAIIGISTSITIPNVIGWLPKYRLNSGAEEIQSTLQLARLGAIKQNTDATVNFNVINHTFVAAIAGKTIKSGRMPSGITIDSITIPSSKVQFDSRGLANTWIGNIVVKNNQGGTKTIKVNIVGNSKIQ